MHRFRLYDNPYSRQLGIFFHHLLGYQGTYLLFCHYLLTYCWKDSGLWKLSHWHCAWTLFPWSGCLAQICLACVYCGENSVGSWSILPPNQDSIFHWSFLDQGPFFPKKASCQQHGNHCSPLYPPKWVPCSIFLHQPGHSYSYGIWNSLLLYIFLEALVVANGESFPNQIFVPIHVFVLESSVHVRKKQRMFLGCDLHGRMCSQRILTDEVMRLWDITLGLDVWYMAVPH